MKNFFFTILLLFKLINEFHFQNLNTSCGDYMTIFYLCCNGALVRRSIDRTLCCGRTTINPTIDMCCDGIVRPLWGKQPKCCGTSSFDGEYFICCDGVLRSKIGADRACCEKAAYDVNLFRCCNGMVVPLESQQSNQSLKTNIKNIKIIT